MLPNVTLALTDGVRIVVPDSVNALTTYVLLEQEDWFEDEIKFLRLLLKSGQKVIDIGANYGVYTLSIAKLVGQTGRVWSYEPVSSTAELLASSIAINNFDQVVLQRSALSNSTGTAQISLYENSEFNELVHDEKYTGKSETVSLVTLDDAWESQGCKNIDFMKIDAEGEEINIIHGGLKFLARESPLIQYEIRAGKNLNLNLVGKFAELGYKSYRLVPGLNLLVPFNADEAVDSYLLNLFCCKSDAATSLAEQGFLIENIKDQSNPQLPVIAANISELLANGVYGWRKVLNKFPYGKMLFRYWEETVAVGQSREVEESLALFALSGDKSLLMTERFAALEASFLKLKKLCESNPPYLRLASLARVARHYGARSITVSVLNRLRETIFEHRKVSLVEPFLVPAERFESISPQSLSSVGNWVAAAVLEELEKNHYFSSYDSGKLNLERLQIIRDLGFIGDEMRRRLDLINQRFGTH